jgi:hypothetical protein|tara:strand:- start:288 stop:590 length:303 start_codon:yes stop_codon:yes gene_type:complete
MIQLIFIGPQRKIIKFGIKNRKIIYFDDAWKGGIQIMPKNDSLIKKMKRGDKNIQLMADLILDSNKGENLKQYNACKTEEDIVEMIRTDCQSKGLIEVRA